MIKLSVVIITFNEERNIERCLVSAGAVADEIVVVDSFSTDRTEEICRKYQVRFIKHAFDGHIQQKNRAITQAESPYVLSLDADEALSDELVQSIREVKKNWKYDGYSFNRLNNYCGKWVKYCGWYPDVKLRLWDSRKGAWTGENPHDCYKLQPGSTAHHIKGDLLHYSYYSITDHLTQVNKFTDIASKELFRKGRKSTFFDLTLRPAWKFKRDYLFRLGFLDGFTGFVICVISAHAAFLKYAKLRQLRKECKIQRLS